MALPAKLGLPFSCLFLHWFSDLFFNTRRACKSAKRGNKSSKSATKSSLKRTHSQGLQKGSVCERSNLWNWQPLHHFQLFSQRPWGLKVKPKTKPKSRLPKTDKNRKKDTLENKKEQDHEKQVRVLILVPNRDQGFAVLVPILSLGPSWDQHGPQVSPDSPRDSPRPHFLSILVV